MAWRNASHLLKLERHVTQIVIAVLQGDGHEVYRFAVCCLLLHGLYRPMKTSQANELLRRDADICTEDTQELAFAQTGDRRHFGSGYIPFRLITGGYHTA